MDDLRSDIKVYFEHFVRDVDLDDIDDSYMIDAVPLAEPRARRSRWRVRGPVVAATAGLLVWGIIGLTTAGPGGDEAASNPSSTAPTPVSTTLPRSAAGPIFPYAWGESFGGFRLQKSATGPQDAEAILYWVDYPADEDVTACGPIGDLAGFVTALAAGHDIPPDQAALTDPDFSLFNTVSDLVATYPGLRLISEPVDVSVDGHPGRHLSLVIEADRGCDPGYFFNWRSEHIGAMWHNTSVGDTMDVWIVDTTGQDDSVLLMVGLADPEFPTLRDEIVELVSSVTLQGD